MRLTAPSLAVLLALSAAGPVRAAALPVANDTLLHSARLWEAHARADLARLALEKLVAARPDRPEFLELLGELCLRSGDVAAARAVLARLEHEHPDAVATRAFRTSYRLATVDRLALASVARLVETGRGEEARHALEALFPEGAPGGYAALEYYRLLAHTPGGLAAAIRGLEAQRAAHPEEPRYALLLGELLLDSPATAARGRRLLDGVARRDDVVPAELAAARGRDRGRAARGAAQAPPPPAPVDFAAIDPLAQRALRAALEARLEARLASAPDDAGAREALAALRFASGRDAEALELIGAGRAAIATPGVAAALWRQAAREARAAGEAARASAYDAAASAFAAHDFEAVVGAAEAGDAAGAPDAPDLLAVAGRLDAGSHWLFATRLRMLVAHGDPDAALALLAARGREPGDADAPLRALALDARASARLAAGDATGATADLEAAHALDAEDPWIAYRLARRYLAAGEPARARAVFLSPGTPAPSSAEGRFAAALVLESLDAREESAALVAAIPQEERSEGMRALAARLAAKDGATAATRAPGAPDPLQSYVTAGLGYLEKPGDAGISQLSAWQLPSEWRLAVPGGYAYARADAVSLATGRLPLSGPVPLLGTLQAAGPAAAADAARADGNARGVALGLGYVGEYLAADLGSTPLGFPVTNVVGGVRFTPTLGPLDLSVGLARRPVTSSELSYAGLRDPVTGRVWGGVVETGPSLQAGYYRSEASLALGVRSSRLTGASVPGNSYTGARLAGDHRVLSGAGLDLYVGGTVTYWSYAENLLNYTYGSGGYYSPQSYLSVGLPLEVIGSGAGFSYRARATVSRSASRMGAEPFYPTDAALEAAAAGAPLPPGYSRPVFDATHGTGTSFAFYAALERELLPGFVLGAALDLDRTDYYHPTSFLLYLRTALPGGAVRLATPPRPVRPYADY